MVELAYGSLTGPESHAAFVKALAQAFDSHLVAIQTDASGHRHSAIAHFDDQGRAFDEMAQHVAGVELENPWLASPMARRLLRDGIAGDEGCLDPKALRRTEFYDYVLRPFDVFHSFGFLIGMRPGELTALSVSRSASRGYHTADEYSLAKRLLPHLRNLYRIQQAIASTTFTHQEQGLSRALWAVDAQGKVAGRNEQAYVVAAGSMPVLSERAGRLHAVYSHDRPILAGLVEQVAAGARLHERTILRDPQGDPVAIAHIHACRPALFQTWLLPQRPTALVVLQPLACSVDDPRPALARVYGLSPAEAKVSTQLLESGSVAAVARVLCRSEETVRSQLKAVYAKTGVNRQASLVRLLYALGSE